MDRHSRQPIELHLKRHESLSIRWSDGVTTVATLRELRRHCPCAACRAFREQRDQNPLAVIPALPRESDMVTAVSAELVGNYALRIVWKDGHDTGIYDYGLLHKLGNQTP
jgi:DUF971 family protein